MMKPGFLPGKQQQPLNRPLGFRGALIQPIEGQPHFLQILIGQHNF